jgi:hypothetical protein
MAHLVSALSGGGGARTQVGYVKYVVPGFAGAGTRYLSLAFLSLGLNMRVKGSLELEKTTWGTFEFVQQQRAATR